MYTITYIVYIYINTGFRKRSERERKGSRRVGSTAWDEDK